MRVEQLLATDPGDGRYADLVRDACASARPRRLRAAIAYATQSGVAELCAALDDIPAWRSARKQWLVGIDYCRSDPLALAHLNNLQRSELRVYDGAFVADRTGCAPRVSYHPKLYLFTGPTGTAAALGSGNLSQTGLRVGVEAGTTLWSSAGAAMRPLIRWFDRHWASATPLQSIAEEYEEQYSALENRRQPTPSEDDDSPASAGVRGQLTPNELRQLRVCGNLWIESGNLHLNRGPGVPGNQLMLKRNTRVFFGFEARDLVPDTAVGSVAIRYGLHDRPDCSLRFSNNSMDVLTLPIPGDEGPEEYDQQVLLFRRIGVRHFELSLGGRADVRRWRSNSERINASFRMASGRRWGVF